MNGNFATTSICFVKESGHLTQLEFDVDEEKIVAHLFKLYAEKTREE